MIKPKKCQQSLKIELTEDGKLMHISGTLSFETVKYAHQRISALLKPMKVSTITIEFAPDIKLDSAALALMVTLQQEAKDRQQQLTYRSIPPSLQSLANAYGVAFLTD